MMTSFFVLGEDEEASENQTEISASCDTETSDLNANSNPSSPSQISARSASPPPPASPSSQISETPSSIDNKYLDVELELAKSLQQQQQSNSVENAPKPKLRLNISLAADPACNPDAKDIKGMVAADVVESPPLTSSSIEKSRAGLTVTKLHRSESQSINAINIVPIVALEPVPTPPIQARIPIYTCVPCGINFSSASTLEAHQTYYCSHRKDQDEPIPALPKAASSSNNDHSSAEPPTKAQKTGKQYACTQCSYSADKKVSLNRHMRMHQSSPASSSITSNGGDDMLPVNASQLATPVSGISIQVPVDRYCSDCDIRFSSTKTYRAHKQHYCQSRHRDGWVLIDKQFFRDLIDNKYFTAHQTFHRHPSLPHKSLALRVLMRLPINQLHQMLWHNHSLHYRPILSLSFLIRFCEVLV